MLKMLFLLPFADFKTISVGQSPAPTIAPDLTADLVFQVIAFAVVVAVIVAGLRYFAGQGQQQYVRQRPPHDRRRSERPGRTVTRRAQANWVVVDGSNVMHWQDNTPRLAPVLQVVNALRDRGFAPGVVFDANAGWKLFGRYLNERELGQMLGLPTNQVLVVPKGTQADPYILATARKLSARIVTNDRFRDWTEAHPEVMQPGFLIRGEMQADWVQLKGLDPTVAAVS